MHNKFMDWKPNMPHKHGTCLWPEYWPHAADSVQYLKQSEMHTYDKQIIHEHKPVIDTSRLAESNNDQSETHIN